MHCSILSQKDYFLVRIAGISRKNDRDNSEKSCDKLVLRSSCTFLGLFCRFNQSSYTAIKESGARSFDSLLPSLPFHPPPTPPLPSREEKDREGEGEGALGGTRGREKEKARDYILK